MRRALPWVGLAIRLGAAAIWLTAGAAKIAGLETFRTQVAAYDLLPGTLVAPFAYALPFVEVGLGLYLLVGLFVRGSGAVSVVLMLLFITAMAQAWARGLTLNCGCFGAAAREKVGLGTILRDAALGIPGLIMFLRPARFLSLDHWLLGRPDAFGGVTAGPLRATNLQTTKEEHAQG